MTLTRFRFSQRRFFFWEQDVFPVPFEFRCLGVRGMLAHLSWSKAPQVTFNPSAAGTGCDICSEWSNFLTKLYYRDGGLQEDPPKQ